MNTTKGELKMKNEVAGSYVVVAVAEDDSLKSVIHKKGFPFPVGTGDHAVISKELADRKADILNGQGYGGVVWQSMAVEQYGNIVAAG